MATVEMQRPDLHPHHHYNSNNNSTHRVVMLVHGSNYCVAQSRISLSYGRQRISRRATVTSPSLSEHRKRRKRGSRHRRNKSASVAESTPITILIYHHPHPPPHHHHPSHHHPLSLINLDSSSCWTSQSITPRSSRSGPSSLST